MRIKVKITVPTKNKEWIVSVGHGNFKRPNATQIYNYVEKRLLATHFPSKIYVIVDYGVEHPLEPNDWKNEGLYSDPTVAPFALASFLEDYFTKDYLREKLKQYQPKE